MSPKSSPPFTVLLADDHPAFREGMARHVSAHPGLELIAALDNGLDALAAIEKLQPDVAVLDLNMPSLTGVEICRRRDPAWRTRILIVTASAVEAVEEEATAAGADGVVSKAASRNAICQDILRIAGRSEP